MERGTLIGFPGECDPLAMKTLDRVPERRAVRFLKHVGPDLDDVIRTHSEEEPIEGGVVQSAQR